MRRGRFTQERIIGILKEHQAGTSASELCRKHGISDATFHNWRSRHCGMEVSDRAAASARPEAWPIASSVQSGAGTRCLA